MYCSQATGGGNLIYTGSILRFFWFQGKLIPRGFEVLSLPSSLQRYNGVVTHLLSFAFPANKHPFEMRVVEITQRLYHALRSPLKPHKACDLAKMINLVRVYGRD